MAREDCFIYGLVDPRCSDDLVRGLRYVGQTSVGMARPKSHSKEWSLEADSNLHKVAWIRSLQAEGLEPRVVVLSRLESADQLDSEEVRLIEHHRALGSPLLNLTDGGGGRRGFEHSEATKVKISEAKYGVPRKDTADKVNLEALLQPGWDSRKAWWLGLTFGQGRAAADSPHYTVAFSSSDRPLVVAWGAYLGLEDSRIRLREDGPTWVSEFGDLRLATWLCERYRLNLKYQLQLEWPDLPKEFERDFIRGVWDAKGVARLKRRPKSGAAERFSTPVAAISLGGDAFMDALVSRSEGLLARTSLKSQNPKYADKCYAAAERSGPKAVEFLRWVYADSHEGLRSELQYASAMQLCRGYDGLIRPCVSCAKPSMLGKDRCRSCAKAKWSGKACSCGLTPIVAKGLCRACYNRQRNVSLKWTGLEKIVLNRLAGYDSKAWKALPEAEQAAQLDELVATYLGRGFPWFALNTAEEAPLTKVRQGALTEEPGLVRSVSRAGQRTCLKFNLHRLSARNHASKTSVVQAFSDEKWLRRAVKLQLSYGDPVDPSGVYRAMMAILRAPLNFPPTLARWLTDRLVPEGGTVLDPCAGYGGRLLGVMASARDARYLGFDITPESVDGGNNLASSLGCSSRASVTLGAVEFTAYPQADLVLTSPPYFDAESYGPEADAALAEHSGLSGWLGGFLRPLIRKSLEAAPQLLLNLGATHAGDLPEHAIRIAQEEGFKLHQQWSWQTSRFGASAPRERLLLLVR